MRNLLLIALLLAAPAASAGTFSKHSSEDRVAVVTPAPPDYTERAEAAVEEIWRSRYRDAQRRMERAVLHFEAQRDIYDGCLRSAGRGWCDASFLNRAAREVNAAQAWLDEGLPDLCRRSGCLPGWVR